MEPATSPPNELDDLTAALNRLDDFPALGRNTLAALPAVDVVLHAQHLSDTPFQRGRILSELLLDLIAREFERCRAQPAARDTAEWAILFLRAGEGRPLQEIAERLGMPRRTVDRYYRRAKGLLLDRLYAASRQTRQRDLYCPLCAHPFADTLVTFPFQRRCSHCAATLDVARDSSGRLVLTAQPSS